MVTVAIGRLIARPPSSPCKSKISRCTMKTMPTNKSDRITRASGCIRTGMHGHVRLETTKRASQNHAMHRYRSAAIDTSNYSTGTVKTPQQKNKSPTQANFIYKRCHACAGVDALPRAVPRLLDLSCLGPPDYIIMYVKKQNLRTKIVKHNKTSYKRGCYSMIQTSGNLISNMTY